MLLPQGCRRSEPGQPAVAAKPVPVTTQVQGKYSAPVTLNLKHTREGGTLRITLEATALADIPNGVARFALPEGLELLEGQTIVELGALKRGEIRTCEIAVDGAANNYRLHAGVDAIYSDTMRLNSSRSLVVGAAPEVESRTRVIKSPGAGDDIRVEEVTPGD